MKFTRLIALLMLIWMSTPLFAEDQIRGEMFCVELNRVLTANDFFENAFEFELTLSRLPDSVSYETFEMFLAINTNNYEVRWVGQPFPERWWGRFFDSSPVQTTITWSTKTDLEKDVAIACLQSACGNVQGRIELTE